MNISKMKITVLHKYVDKKIENAIADGKNIEETVKILEDWILYFKNPGNMRQKYRDYIISFLEKRITDVQFMHYMFEAKADHRLITLISIKDKICGLEDFNL